MTIFQLLTLVLLIIVVYKATKRLVKKELSIWLYLLWLSGWGLVAVFVIWPGILSWIAFSMGIGRGVDLVIYLSIFALFYFAFKVNLRINKLEKNISEMVRKIAIGNVYRGKKE